VQYGMGEKSLAESLGEPAIVGRGLLRLHRQTYPTFWKWSEAAVNHALLYGWLQTVFGWKIHVGPHANPRPQQRHEVGRKLWPRNFSTSTLHA